MRAIETLMKEHRTAESVVDSLCLFARTVAEQRLDQRDALARFVDLFRVFDELHHRKEEDVLFERMLCHGFSREHGPLAVMLADHETCRKLVARLAILADRADAWTDDDRRLLGEIAIRYALFLKAHIAKEDNVLYPMSERVVPPPEWSDIDRSFDELEARWGRDGTLIDFCERVSELRERWPAADGPRPGGCAG